MRRYIKDILTHEWRWVEDNDSPVRVEKQPPKRAGYVIPDIEPYKSMVTGEVISGRRQHREHLRQHGLIEAGNEKQEFFKREEPRMRPAALDIKEEMQKRGIIG